MTGEEGGYSEPEGRFKRARKGLGTLEREEKTKILDFKVTFLFTCWLNDPGVGEVLIKDMVLVK